MDRDENPQPTRSLPEAPSASSQDMSNPAKTVFVEDREFHEVIEVDEAEELKEDEEEEEELECGFCLFMKGGGCKDTFVAWEKCVEEAEKNGEDIVEKCFEVTGLLKKCMDEHADYYEPVLRAEKAMEEEAVKALDAEGTSDGKTVAIAVDAAQEVPPPSQAKEATTQETQRKVEHNSSPDAKDK